MNSPSKDARDLNGSSMANAGASTFHLEESTLLTHDVNSTRQDRNQSHDQDRDNSQLSHEDPHDGEDHDPVEVGMSVITRQLRKCVLVNGVPIPFAAADLGISVNQDRHRFQRNYDPEAVELWSMTNAEKTVL